MILIYTINMITIKKNNKPNLSLPEFICDTPLHKKLDRYDLTKFLNKHSTNLLIGKAGSGKTSMLYALMTGILKKVYHDIYVFQPEASQSSIKNNVLDKLPDENKFDALDPESLQEVYDRILAEEKEYNKAIIIDDQTIHLKNKDVERLLKDLIFNRRHYGVSIYFLVQNYTSVPLSIRKAFTNLFIFKINKKEMGVIFDEAIEQKKEIMDEVYKMVYNKPHNYLFINTDTQRLFKNFDELLIEE